MWNTFPQRDGSLCRSPARRSTHRHRHPTNCISCTACRKNVEARRESSLTYGNSARSNEEHVESMEAPMEQETLAATSNDHRSRTVRSTTDVSRKFESEVAITLRLFLVSGTVLHDVANQYISSTARSSEGSTSSIPSPYSFASTMLPRLVDLRRISTEKECAQKYFL